MALSGAGLLAFVLVHMAGNLQIFLGPRSLQRLRLLFEKQTGSVVGGPG